MKPLLLLLFLFIAVSLVASTVLFIRLFNSKNGNKIFIFAEAVFFSFAAFCAYVLYVRSFGEVF